MSSDPAGFPDGPNGHFYAPVPTSGVDPLGLELRTSDKSFSYSVPNSQLILAAEQSAARLLGNVLDQIANSYNTISAIAIASGHKTSLNRAGAFALTSDAILSVVSGLTTTFDVNITTGGSVNTSGATPTWSGLFMSPNGVTGGSITGGANFDLVAVKGSVEVTGKVALTSFVGLTNSGLVGESVTVTGIPRIAGEFGVKVKLAVFAGPAAAVALPFTSVLTDIKHSDTLNE